MSFLERSISIENVRGVVISGAPSMNFPLGPRVVSSTGTDSPVFENWISGDKTHETKPTLSNLIESLHCWAMGNGQCAHWACAAFETKITVQSFKVKDRQRGALKKKDKKKGC